MRKPQPYNDERHTPQYLCTELGLYSPLDISAMTSTEYDSLKRYDFEDCTVDAYCLQCQEKSVFRGVRMRPMRSIGVIHRDRDQPRDIERGTTDQEGAAPPDDCVNRDSSDDFQWTFACARAGCGDKLFYFFHMQNARLTKVGQWPSIADLSLPEIETYRPVLGDSYGELARAIGLYAHGVGVGSFVYLRRIFERLIQDTYARNMGELNCADDEFLHIRMDQKIGCLRDHLPDFLVQNASVYEILSKGIHELDDDECLGYFGIVRDGIELILSEELQRLETERRQRSLHNQIANLTGRLRSAQDS